MELRSKSACCYFCVVFASLLLGLVILISAQTAKPAQSYPAHLPYSFGNFVWWSDEELRGLLKQRIPGLGDEIAPASTTEGRVREALKVLLKEKGIVAEIQCQEPSPFSLSAERAPGAPGPAIGFLISSPRILVDKVVISNSSESLLPSLRDNLRRREGHEFSTGQYWLVRSNAEEELEQKGYLEGKVTVGHDRPRREDDHYLVDLVVSVDAGPQYHVSSITADGGPLLRGRNLSQFFAQKAGDVAGLGPFGRLAGELRSFYWRYGYADVLINGPQILDHANALVSYHLEVIPGPVYHLRSLTIHNLNAAQESKARELLGMKPGDVFDEMAINGLYHKLSAEPSLVDFGFTFGPAKDKSAAAADLTLDFYKVSDKSSVTIK
jgi:hypothetical protein